MKARKTVIVGMSGGVDSSVAAFLLKKEGYHVTGVFMYNWDEKDPRGECLASQDYKDVKRVCAKLDIPHLTVNFVEEYQKRVFSVFLEGYKKGRTPNPDVLCNKEIKFKAFFDKVQELGADYVATGHYCRIEKGDLLKARDEKKDQSYFLGAINGKVLDRVLFPLGNLEKEEVRRIAQENNLHTYNKKDSTGLCFIGERRFRPFLAKFLQTQAGDFQTLDGKKVGEHQGVSFYTLGQRRQLGLGGVGKRWYVIKKDVVKNIVYVERDGDHPELFSDQLVADDLVWIGEHPKLFPYSCWAKIRYGQEDQKCRIQKIEDGQAIVDFETPQRAVAPGQVVVFYEKKRCLGSGTIQRATRSQREKIEGTSRSEARKIYLPHLGGRGS